MWRERIQKLTEGAIFNAPADRDTISSISAAFKVRVPPELEALLAESNGVTGEYGLGIIWNCEKILADNNNFRTNGHFSDLYMPFDSLLFFGDAGNGDQFAFAIRHSGKITRQDVFAWNHEDDSRKWVAPSLETYLEWWLTGKMKI